jgi:cytochrome c oxidase subunit 2
LNIVSKTLLLLPSASTAAGGIDLLFWAITLVSAFFSLGICAAIVYFAVRYRRGHRVDRSNAPAHNDTIELVWTVVPLVIALVLFFWAAIVYFIDVRPPRGAMEIYCVGKQWMWKLQHPEGRWEMNEMHVPVGKPVVLTMTSEDVIHSFFVPAFRLKMDVFPGQYTQMWFTATRTGTYPLYCAEFCGTLHSKMTGTVTVMEPADYERWLSEGTVSETMATAGAKLFQQLGCSGCHGGNGSVRAPLLNGIYGGPVAVQLPPPGMDIKDDKALARIPATTVIADARYIHDSILLPDKEIAAGYKPVMPSFEKRLSEEQIMQLIAYIRSLATGTGTSVGPMRGPQQPLSREEYKTRTGFVPKNIKKLTGPSK